jgi:hypothetical protein
MTRAEELSDLRLDAAAVEREAKRDEAEEVVEEARCSYCLELCEEDEDTCGSDDCRAWEAADLAADEAEDEPYVFAV